MSSIIVEESCFANLFSRVQKSSVPISGFLVGHSLDDLDFIVHTVRLSDKFRYFDPTSLETLSEENGCKANSNQKAEIFPDEEAAILHAKHIYRMLPGGTRILGFFMLGEKKQLLESQAILTKLAATVSRMQIDNCDDQPKDDYRFLVMSYDWSTKKTNITLTRYSSGQRTTITVPYTEKRLQYAQFRCALTFDLQLILPLENGCGNGLPFDEKCHQALAPFSNRAKHALLTFDGKLCDVRDQIPNVTTGKKATLAPIAIIDARMLLPPSDEENFESTGNGGVEKGSKMHIKGNILCHIQLPQNKLTYGQVRRALLDDLARSLGARLFLHAEGLSVLEGDAATDADAYHRLPRRVFWNKRQLFADYLFETETSSDALKNFADVLDIDVEKVDDIQDGLETVPDETALFDTLNFSRFHHKAHSVGSMESVEQLAEMENRLHLSRWTAFYVFAGILVGFLACFLYFLINNYQNTTNIPKNEQ